MKTGKSFRKIVMLIALLMLITSTVGTTYGFILAKTDTIANVFVPGDSNTSSLIISKAIEHPLGDNYVIPNNLCFDFKIELGSYYANAKLNTSQGQMTADSNGVLLVTFNPNTTFTIEGLKHGTEVKVTEEPANLIGFSVKGESSKTVTINKDSIASVNFVNTYTPNAVKPSGVTVSGIKTLVGREWQDGDGFTFILEQKNGDNWTKIDEQSVVYQVDNTDFNKFDFNDVFQNLTFDKVGTYDFRISEELGNLDEVDYDKTVNNFSVKVTDVDMDGSLEIGSVNGTENITVSETNDAYTVFVTFNNTYIPPAVDPEPITVIIGIDKIVNNIGTATHGLEGFQFELKNIDTSEILSTKSTANGKASFELSFTKDDIGKVYKYSLSETNQGLAGMSYDTDVHEITVTVSLSSNNKLVAELTMDGNAADELHAEFENTYNAEKPSSPLTGYKSNILIWFILMLVSASMLVAVIVYDRRCNKPQQ